MKSNIIGILTYTQEIFLSEVLSWDHLLTMGFKLFNSWPLDALNKLVWEKELVW